LTEKLIIEDFQQFGGKHCQTTALKSLLDYHGLHLSEEMLFGLGGGVGFIYWYMKNMPSPFIGTRGGKVEEFLLNCCKRIGAEASIFQTASAQKGHEELLRLLSQGEPAYVFVDMPYLSYLALPEVAHFGGHAVVVYGLDEKKNKVYISDRGNGPVSASIEELKKARSSAHPPFPAKNKLLRIKYPARIANLEKGIREAIQDCLANMINPPIRNIGLAGIKKWADTVPKWPSQFKGVNLLGALFNVYIYIEVGGTGGSAFRTMYAQFFRESSSILNKPALREVAEMFENSGRVWREIAAAALPDSWAALKGIRELSFEKNRIFEEQEPGALEKMKKINAELDDLAKKAIGDLEKKDTGPLVDDLRQKILEGYEIESEAFQELESVMR